LGIECTKEAKKDEQSQCEREAVRFPEERKGEQNIKWSLIERQQRVVSILLEKVPKMRRNAKQGQQVCEKALGMTGDIQEVKVIVRPE